MRKLDLILNFFRLLTRDFARLHYTVSNPDLYYIVGLRHVVEVCVFSFCSLRTSTSSCIASGTVIAWTTMKRKGRRRAVRLMKGLTKPGN